MVSTQDAWQWCNTTHLLAFSLIFLQGCSSNQVKSHLTPTHLQSRPQVEIQSTAGDAVKHALSFRLLSPSMLEEQNRGKTVDTEQHHLLFTLRNTLEGRGYRVAAEEEEADLLATIYAVNGYSSNVKTQGEKLRLRWRIGQRLQGEGEHWRDAPDLSGTPPSGIAVKRAANETDGGRYLPQIAITLFDAHKLRAIWTGQAAALSSNSDIRVSSQQLVRALASRIPLSHHRTLSYPPGSGKLGLGYSVVTVDGDRYYPVVTGTDKDGGADKAGVRIGDLVLRINGTATQNRSTGEVAGMFAGAAGSRVVLDILRTQQPLQLELQRTMRDQVTPLAMTDKMPPIPATTRRYVINPRFENLDELSEEAHGELDALLLSIRATSPQRLKVVAHTDTLKINPRSQLRYRNNEVLSQARAEIVAEYLRDALGLGANQISAYGMGGAEPVASNATVQGREQNRRLEIFVTGRHGKPDTVKGVVNGR